MLTVPLAYGGRAHLLKFEVPEFPLVVENEAFFLDVARRLRHPVVEASIRTIAVAAQACLSRALIGCPTAIN